VVGSSLHDPSLVRLLLEAEPATCGWFVAPGVSPAAARRLESWNLATIDADADGFMGALAIELLLPSA
jgi:hypothetical protein